MTIPTGLGTPATAAAPDASSLVPTHGRLLGAFVSQDASPTMPAAADSQSALEAFEHRVGRKLDLHRMFLRWDDDLAQGRITADITRGRTPVLSVRPQRRDGTKLMWAQVANGSVDAEIVRQARAVKALGAPLFLAFHHEPDMERTFGTPAEYRAAWRHYVDVFRAEGASNAAFTWIMTPASFGSAAVGAGADAYYPGDDIIDWLALDAYNWYGCAAGKPIAWRPLSTIVSPFRRWAEPHGKPLMLAEWGSAEDPADPTRKAKWFTESARALDAWPEVKAVSYFQHHGNCAWWVDTSAQSELAFATIAAASSAHGRDSASLQVDQEVGVAPFTVTFDGSASAGAGHPSSEGIASWTLDFGDGTPAVNGTGTPPTSLSHTFSAGTRTVTLTVVAATGAVATDVRTVVAQGAPTISGHSTSGISDTTASLNAWVKPQGLATTVTFEWGTDLAYGRRYIVEVESTATTAAAKAALTGLTPGTRYYWRVAATSAGGSALLDGRHVDTTGAPTPVLDVPTKVTATSAMLNAHVHPHSLDTRLWFEVTGGGVTFTTPEILVEKHTDYRWRSSGVSSLRPGTTYAVQTVAENSSGRSSAGPRTFTTAH